jgi:hypothetical protein
LQQVKNSKKTKQLLGFQKPRKKNPPKQESLVFLETTVHRVGETAENQQKNQGENQGSRKPSVLVGFLRQKKGLCIPFLLWREIPV